MGIGVDVLTIQEISDEEDYPNALGKRRTPSQARRDDRRAEAHRDANQVVAGAAGREQAKFKADAGSPGVARDFMIRRAQCQAEIETQKARAARPALVGRDRAAGVVEEVKIERMRTEQISVQEQEVLRKQKELEATVIKPAEADRLAAVVRAEASKQSAILEAEGRRSAMIALAEAEQEKMTKEGRGRAAAVEAEGRAEAAKIEAIGLAQAKAIEAQGTAEAAAILRKAEAWKEFNDAARLQTILEKLPAIITASSGVFGAVAAPLGNIDKLVVIDQGNGNAEGGSSGLGRLAKTSPAIVFNLLQQLEALGLNLPAVLQQLGVNTAPASVNGDSTSSTVPTTTPPREPRTRRELRHRPRPCAATHMIARS